MVLHSVERTVQMWVARKVVARVDWKEGQMVERKDETSAVAMVVARAEKKVAVTENGKVEP